ncbi:MAG: ABC transporter ATP-binding protein [Microbacteriaceae bacterium]
MLANVLSLENVSLVRNGNSILDSVNFTVAPNDRWVVLGPNGAGKTSILRLASTTLHPTAGKVTILDQKLGKSDVFEVRSRVGMVSSAVARAIPEQETALDVVVTAAFAVTGRWREEYEHLDFDRAKQIMAQWQVEHLSERKFGSLSDGERKRVLISRALMTDPEMLLLDEPAASLDLGSREHLIRLLSTFASSPIAPAMVMVTHHVEEIPPGFTHALLLKDGKVLAQGELDSVVTAENLSSLYDLPILLDSSQGRFSARAR